MPSPASGSSESAQPGSSAVLPDGHADLLFHGSGEVEIVGVADTVALPTLAAGTVLRGVRLRPAAVGAALRVPGVALAQPDLARR